MIARRVRFLILRGGALGDFIVTLPALRLIRDRWPDAHITLIGYPYIAQLALEDGLVDELESLDKAGIATFFASRPLFTPEQVDFVRSFDLVFSWLHDRNGTVENNLKLAGAKQVLYGSPLIPDDTHAVDHLIKPLENLALYEHEAVPRLHISAKTRAWGESFLAARHLNRPVWAIHPGSGSAQKNWPIDRYLELYRLLSREGTGTALWLFGEADQSVCEAVSAHVPDAQMARALSLSELAGVLVACQGYLGNDSGVSHLAAALGLPVVTLFGPSDPRQWGPRGERVHIERAPAGALADLSVPAVLEACVRMWGMSGSI